MEITLSPEEQRYAKYLAKKRHEHARKEGKVNVRKGPQSDEITDLEGIAGEMAYCKLMNVYPDFQIDVIPDADCLLHTGHAVDVKTTKYASGRLIAARWKGEGVDVYALMIGEFPTYKFAGFADKESLIDPKNLTDLGHPGRGKVFAMAQEDLNQPF